MLIYVGKVISYGYFEINFTWHAPRIEEKQKVFPKIGSIIISQSFISGQATICNLEVMKVEGDNKNTRGIS